MKKLSFYIVALLLLVTANTNAQIVKVDRKYGSPTWAPKAPTTVKYYYLPDINTYYDVPARRYIYNNNGSWVRSASLPADSRGYNLKTGQTVYLSDYNGNAPYTLFKKHKVKYRGNGNWKRNGHDNGLHKGHYKGHKGPNGRKEYKDDKDDRDNDDRKEYREDKDHKDHKEYKEHKGKNK